MIARPLQATEIVTRERTPGVVSASLFFSVDKTTEVAMVLSAEEVADLRDALAAGRRLVMRIEVAPEVPT